MFCIMFAQSFELITMYLPCDEADGLTPCVSDSHKVMTALVVMLFSNVCCGDFSGISYIYMSYQ